MKISVVMTVYNGSKYLKKQLQSVLQQTRIPDQIVIADDCSTDDSMQIVEQVKENWSQIEWCVYTNQSNLGWQKNFMQAFEHASGDLIFCSDQDDIWTNEKIAHMEEAFQKNPQVELMGCDYTLIGKEGTPAGNRRMLYSSRNASGPLEKVPLTPIFYEAVRPGCAVAFRKSFLQIAKAYWIKGYPHDELLWNIAVLRGTAFVLHESLLEYRIHGENTTRAQNTREERFQMLEYQENACLQCVKYAKENHMSDKQVSMLEKAVCFFQLRNKALQEKNALCLLHVLRYIQYYTYMPAYLKDWQYLLKNG